MDPRIVLCRPNFWNFSRKLIFFLSEKIVKTLLFTFVIEVTRLSQIVVTNWGSKAAPCKRKFGTEKIQYESPFMVALCCWIPDFSSSGLSHVPPSHPRGSRRRPSSSFSLRRPLLSASSSDLLRRDSSAVQNLKLCLGFLLCLCSQ